MRWPSGEKLAQHRFGPFTSVRIPFVEGSTETMLPALSAVMTAPFLARPNGGGTRFCEPTYSARAATTRATMTAIAIIGRIAGRRHEGNAVAMVLTGNHLSGKLQPGRCGVRSVRLSRVST